MFLRKEMFFHRYLQAKIRLIHEIPNKIIIKMIIIFMIIEKVIIIFMIVASFDDK